MRILYCVLNWGLGHAARSVSVIRALQQAGCIVEIASDGDPLKLLQQAFPEAVSHALPGYDIRYYTGNVLFNALSQMRRIKVAIRAEHDAIQNLTEDQRFDAIISDNRYGCYKNGLPSIMVTHQLRNLARSSLLSWSGEKFVDRYIKHFDEIWVPDTPDRALSGILTESPFRKLRFIGYLSDQKHIPQERTYKIAAILSGPEPQRSRLEKILVPQLQALNVPCVLVRGIVKAVPPTHYDHLTVFPFKDRRGIQGLLNSSEMVICRSGYSSIMDLLQVGKKALLIPTPGQPEQIYLGKRLWNHTQFVVQDQKKIDIRAAMQMLMDRPPVKPAEINNTLLTDVITNFVTTLSAE